MGSMQWWTVQQWTTYMVFLIQYGIMSIGSGDYSTFIQYWNGM